MSQFEVTNESTEDTLAATANLQEAIRIAREVARQSRPGDPVSVECEGKAIRQFIRLQDGSVAEQEIARNGTP